jgi:hypothetical protein
MAGLSAPARSEVTVLAILFSVAASVGALAIISFEAAVCTLATALALTARMAGLSALVSPAVTILVILLSVAALVGSFLVINLGAAVCTFASALAPLSC